MSYQRKRTRWQDALKNRHIRQEDVGQGEARNLYHGCAGKIRHPSKSIALGVKRAMEAGSKSYDEWESISIMDAYRCRLCGSWHLGHRPGSGKRSAAINRCF